MRQSRAEHLFKCFLLPPATMSSSDSDRDLEFIGELSDRFVRTLKNSSSDL